MISIGGTQLIKLINSKISSSEGQSLLTKTTETVINAVRTVLQTYVDTLKAEGKFDEASQKLALLKAKDIALNQETVAKTLKSPYTKELFEQQFDMAYATLLPLTPFVGLPMLELCNFFVTM